MIARQDYSLNNNGGYTFGAPLASPTFRKNITKMSWDNLLGLLIPLKKDPKGVEREINAIIQELIRRKNKDLQSLAKEGNTAAAEDLATLDGLLAKLDNHTITKDDMDTMALLLGIDPALLDINDPSLMLSDITD
jgi:hypothetical protein